MYMERRYIQTIYLDYKPLNCFTIWGKKPSIQEKDTEKQKILKIRTVLN